MNGTPESNRRGPDPSEPAASHGYGVAPDARAARQPRGGLGGGELSVGDILTILARHPRSIVLTAAVVVLAMTVFVGTRAPGYLATATIRLEPRGGVTGALEDLLSNNEPAAAAEIAVVRSRSLAEEVVGRESGLPVMAPDELWQATQANFDPAPVGAALQMESAGLTTIVEAHDRRPWVGILDRIEGRVRRAHRLRARIRRPGRPGPGTAAGDEGSPVVTDLDVHFVDEVTLRIAPHEGFLLGRDMTAREGMDLVETEYVPGGSLEVFGVLLELDARGDFVGQTYRVRLQSQSEALEQLMRSTTAGETGRGSNVVRIGVEAGCPYRAAETVNALAKNYIRRSVLFGRQRADRTERFIRDRLEVQTRDLERAERELAELQQQHPQLISLQDSAAALIQRISGLEVQRTELLLAHEVLMDALALLRAGDYDGLARLGESTTNLVSMGYVQELTALEAESLRLDRMDLVGFRSLLLTERQRLEVEIAERTLRIESLERAEVALTKGDSRALAGIPARLSVSVDAAVEALSEIEARIVELEAIVQPGAPELVDLMEARRRQMDLALTQLQGARAAAQAELQGYRRLRDEYSSSIEAWPVGERDTIDGVAADLRERVVASLEGQAGGITDLLADLQGQIEGCEGQLREIPEAQLDLAKAQREVTALLEIVAFLARSEQETGIASAATTAGVVLIDPAVPPVVRSAPKVTRFLLISLILGIGLGCAVAFLLDVTRSALHTEAAVEHATGLPVIGSVPNYERGQTRIRGFKKGVRILPMRDDASGPQAESYRAIRAALRQALHGEGALRTLASTSCTAGEGKTVTNSDLAIVFAKAGRRVLLVDCDLRRAEVHNLFGIPRGPGFADVLEGRSPWRDCVRASGIDSLDVLPAGQSTSNVGELLVSERSLETLESLRSAYDLVVFDLPPAALVADVANFATNLDALILVYRSGKVPGPLVTRTVAMLQQAGVRLLGTVINAVPVSRMSSLYGYGYGYGYGTDYGSGLETRPEDRGTAGGSRRG